MYVSSLLHRSVVTQDSREKVGQLVEVLFDAHYREVVGFRLQQGRNTSSKSAQVFLWRTVQAIAEKQVTIVSSSELRSEARYVPLAQALTFQQVLATKVVNQEGALLGTIHDVDLDEQAHFVQALLIRPIAKNQRARAEAVVPINHVTQGSTADTIILDTLGETQVLQGTNHPS